MARQRAERFILKGCGGKKRGWPAPTMRSIQHFQCGVKQEMALSLKNQGVRAVIIPYGEEESEGKRWEKAAWGGAFRHGRPGCALKML